MKIIEFINFAENARRRDLTFNAMSMDFEGNIFDYHNGIADLQNGVVRFVGNAADRIQEDYLRILRYFRFAARTSDWQKLNMPEETIEAIRVHQDGLASISKERIWQEMSKLFVAPFGVRIVSIMQDIGINEVIGLPEMSHAFSWNKRDVTAIVASFFQGQPGACRVFCRSWKMSNEITDKASFIAGHTTILNESTIQDLLVSGIPRDWVVDAINVSFLRTFAETWEIPTFPVNGQDLLDRGFVQGKVMGQKLTALKSRWIDSRFTLTKEELLND